MSIRWDDLEQKKTVLADQLASGNISSSDRQKVQTEFSQLSGLIDARSEVLLLEQKISENNDANLDDDELKELLEMEQEELKSELETKKAVLDDLLFPPDDVDKRSVYVEIRAGAGGQEAALFAADLLRMYTNYSLRQGWSLTIVSSSETDLKGYREVVAHIKGKGVFGALRRESGVHRVQRVPSTETSGRVHTSTVTVAILPEVKDDGEIDIAPSDLRIDVFRASGAGGQHVNTTDSAVRITHIPTGVVVSCQDERSQHKNKASAMKVLKSRILAEQTRQREEEMSKKRRDQIGGGTRAEKVRTYNFPQNRVTDHQVDVTLKKLDMVMEGELDEIIVALQRRGREIRREEAMAKFS